MAVILAFDVYGTLINTHSVVTALREVVGEKADEFSRNWREKQLEYSFRRGLMQNYVDFSICTEHALAYVSEYHKLVLSETQKGTLLNAYRVLPIFDDVGDALDELQAGGFQLYAFSNGSQQAVEGLLTTAGILDRFVAVVSVDDLKSFKPNPAVYSYFLRRSGVAGSDAWMISSNPFDVIGAISAGMKAAWIKRSDDIIFDPWGIEPTITVRSLLDLATKIPA